MEPMMDEFSTPHYAPLSRVVLSAANPAYIHQRRCDIRWWKFLVAVLFRRHLEI